MSDTQIKKKSWSNILKSVPCFSLRVWKHKELKEGEEYCWAIKKKKAAGRGFAAAD
jgi:hypothetical protein